MRSDKAKKNFFIHDESGSGGSGEEKKSYL
jgi:hypothetical protein